MPLFSRKAVFMFARRLMPRLRKMLIPTPAAAAMHYKHALSRCRQIRDRLSRLVVQSQRSHRHLQNQILARVPRAVRAFAMPPAVSLELAVVAVTQQRIV